MPDPAGYARRISFLAPDIIAAILAGRQPVLITRQRVINTELPISWSEQRTLFGCA